MGNSFQSLTRTPNENRRRHTNIRTTRRNSATVQSDFKLLHAKQAGSKLSSLFVPCRDRGLAWSTVSATPPQNQHKPLSLNNVRCHLTLGTLDIDLSGREYDTKPWNLQLASGTPWEAGQRFRYLECSPDGRTRWRASLCAEQVFWCLLPRVWERRCHEFR